MRKGVLAGLVFLLVFSSFALGIDGEILGKENHITLLAVQEVEGKYKGSIADLYLELKEGSGRVFLETFPLTKMDTQISTRFAKEIACDYFDLDCNKYDFIYTIKAKSSIIGGPSAGAAIAGLTAIALLDLEYDEEVTVTGTINSGGIVGPVGGVKEKLEAATENGLKKVLVAKGGGSYKEDNKTVDLIKYAQENLSLDVIEVGDLNDVLFYFTGKRLKEDSISVKISVNYQEIMEELAGSLCKRTEELKEGLEKFRTNESELMGIEEKENSSRTSLEKGDYYSAASFCFGANILIKELAYDKENKSFGWMVRELNKLKKKVSLIEEKLKKEKIETISDLQAMMVVKERLNEVNERIEKFDGAEDKFYALAYMQERFFSAVSWMYFFKMEGKEFVFDEERLKSSCMKKISEGEERYQYVELIFGGFDVGHIKDKMNEATVSLNEGEYDLCLIKAVQAKAEANAILGGIGLSEENFMDFLESKMKAVEKVIAESGEEEVFPILGYSYYQYANSLKETEKYSALLYLEYALEMSDLDIYFEEEKAEEERKFKLELSAKEWLMFGEGFILGFLTVLLIIFGRRMVKGKKKGKKRKRRL